MVAPLLAATVLLAVCSHAVAAPSTEPTQTLDEATARAVELENEIDDLRGEQIAIEERLSVTNLRIFAQQEILAATRKDMRKARAEYRDRLVRIYKSRTGPLTLLLGAESLSDFYARAVMLTRIVERDRHAYENAAITSAEAAYQATVLDGLKAHDLSLRQIRETRLEKLEQALDEQKEIVSQLTAEQRLVLEETRATISLTRQQWKDSSIPTDEIPQLEPATVQPYSATYLTSVHHPDQFRTTGKTMTAVCSWYGNEFHGRFTASGQLYNQDDLTCASKTLPFGTWLALTRGGKRIIVVVTDRGPFVDGRDLDLSRRAARELGFSGVEPVQVEFVEPLN